MRAVDLKILKNKLSEYVSLAASGERVLVTDQGRVVAELVPVALPEQGAPPRIGGMTFDEAMKLLDETRADRFK